MQQSRRRPRHHARIASRDTRNVTLHNASATAMPFADGTFDLIVSNLGVNKLGLTVPMAYVEAVAA